MPYEQEDGKMMTLSIVAVIDKHAFRVLYVAVGMPYTYVIEGVICIN